MPAKTVVKNPQSAPVYVRTNKGVLAFKKRTAKLPAQFKDIFACIDGKSSVAVLSAQLKMGPKELTQVLDTLEESGYIKLFEEGDVADSTEGPDLDFTAADTLSETGEDEAAKGQANVDERDPDEAVRTAAAAAESQASAQAEAQRKALEARIRELEEALNVAEQSSGQIELQMARERAALQSAEAELQVLRRGAPYDAGKADARVVQAEQALAETKSLLAEEHKRAEELARKLAAAEAKRPAPEAQTGTLQEALAQAQDTIAHVELQLATERETREQMIQALREAQSEAEVARNAAEMRLKETEIALQQAQKVERQNRERLRQLEAQIDAGRRARADAEAALETERRTREEADQALRDLQGAAEEARTRAEVQLQMLAEAATARETLQAELTQAKLECERASAAATQERTGREEATQALLEVKKVISRVVKG